MTTQEKLERLKQIDRGVFRRAPTETLEYLVKLLCDEAEQQIEQDKIAARRTVIHDLTMTTGEVVGLSASANQDSPLRLWFEQGWNNARDEIAENLEEAGNGRLANLIRKMRLHPKNMPVEVKP